MNSVTHKWAGRFTDRLRTAVPYLICLIPVWCAGLTIVAASLSDITAVYINVAGMLVGTATTTLAVQELISRRRARRAAAERADVMAGLRRGVAFLDGGEPR